MALRKTIRNLAGAKRTATKSYSEPLAPVDVAVAITQLQETLNETITRLNALAADFNTHVHSGVTAGGANTAVKTSAAVTAVTGAVVADTALFTP